MLMRKTNIKLDNRGSAFLIIVIFAVMLLAVLGWSLTIMQSGDFESNTRNMQSEQALYLAEGGAQWALNLLKATPAWRTDTGHGYASGYAQFTFGPGQHRVVCRNPVSPETGTAVIDSIGYVPSQASYQGMREVKLIVTLGSGSSNTFGDAVYATGTVNMSGNATVNSIPTGYKGAVVTEHNLSMSGNAAIAEPPSPPGNTQNIVQNYVPPTPLPDVTVPTALTGLSTSPSPIVSGNDTGSIPTGNHKYAYIDISGNGVITITGPADIYLTNANSIRTSGNAGLVIDDTNGPVTFYIDGALNINGNGNMGTDDHNANSLTIYGTATNTQNINLTGNGRFAGVIYAPHSDLNISGNGGYYGSYTGNDVNISGNGNVHYDETLVNKTFPGGGGQTTVSWREI